MKLAFLQMLMKWAFVRLAASTIAICVGLEGQRDVIGDVEFYDNKTYPADHAIVVR